MAQLKHKIFGTGEIIGRDGNHITVRFKGDGAERTFSIPESFMFGHFEVDEDLKNDIEAAINAKKEAERAKHEATAAATAAAAAQVRVASTPSSGTKRSPKRPAKVKIKGVIERDFEDYLIISGYSVETPQGLPSVVSAYIRAVKYVLKQEGLTWHSLTTNISAVVALYGEGGAKEKIGMRQHKTYINALRRFEDFVNNSALPCDASNNNSL